MNLMPLGDQRGITGLEGVNTSVTLKLPRGSRVGLPRGLLGMPTWREVGVERGTWQPWHEVKMKAAHVVKPRDGPDFQEPGAP